MPEPVSGREARDGVATANNLRVIARSACHNLQVTASHWADNLEDMDRTQVRRRLDRRLAAWQELPVASSARPHAGWVRAIRDALGMSAADLATRLGVSQIAVTKLEASERAGRVRLDTLERAAHALDCELVYALVPRTSLEAIVRAQAERVLARDFSAVVNSMRLEDQGLSEDDERDARLGQVERILNERGLWRVDA